MSIEWANAVQAIADEIGRTPPPPVPDDDTNCTNLLNAERAGFALCAMPARGNAVGRFADVFVGVTSDAPATVAVAIPAAHVRWVLSVRPGTITPPLDGRSFLPMIYLRFHEVTFEVLDGDSVRLVGAHLSSDARRGCFDRPHAFEMSDGKTLVIANGMAGVTDAPPDDVYMMPDAVGEAWDREAALARRQFWDESMAEFVARTWQPARHVQWCLPIDEVPHDPLIVHDVRVDVDAILADVGISTDGPPRMLPLSEAPVAATILRDLAASLGMRVSGGRFVAGSTPDGIHNHRDEPICGGDLGLIVYLTDCVGGRLVFEDVVEDGDEEVQPGRGVVATWGIRRLHRAERVRGGEKRFVFVETCRV
jgi:hypothetical protein